jgi:hypothetical protein
MSMFNLLNAKLKCVHCKVENEMEIELFFGDRKLNTYGLGDYYPLDSNETDVEKVKSLSGEGYAECGNCRACFYVIVWIKNKHLHSLEIDWSKPIHLPS